MKLIAILVALTTALAVSSASGQGVPDTCAPEDREISGNTNSPCKWDAAFQDATSLEFLVVREADTCYGALRVHGIGRANVNEGVTVYLLRQNDFVHFPQFERVHFEGRTENYMTARVTRKYSLADSIPSAFRVEGHVGQDHYVQHVGGLAVNIRTADFPLPSNVVSVGDMLNACLAQVKIELESEAEALRQEEAETEAVLEAETKAAQAEAERLAALRQAEADAAVDAINKQSAETQLEIIREAEKVKTQALKDQLARQLVISGILADIARVRSSYAEQRSVITNEFLKTRAAASSELAEEVAGYETRIREYRRLNTLLFDQITKQQEAIAARLAEIEALEEDDMADLDTLREDDEATALQGQQAGNAPPSETDQLEREPANGEG